MSHVRLRQSFQMIPVCPGQGTFLETTRRTGVVTGPPGCRFGGRQMACDGKSVFGRCCENSVTLHGKSGEGVDVRV